MVMAHPRWSYPVNCRNSRGEAKRGEDGVDNRESFVVIGGREFRGGFVSVEPRESSIQEVSEGGKYSGRPLVPQSKPPPPLPPPKEMDFRERLPTFHQSTEGRSKLLHPLTRTISFSKMECLQGMGKARSIIGVGGEIAKRIRVVNEPLENISSDLGFSGHTLAEGGTLCISSFEWM
ncbi:hypothetical protein Bca4012_047010 [Brassica carinata]